MKKRTVFDFNAVNINGENESLSKYKGKVLLILNLYHKCRWTPQIRDFRI